MEVSDLHRSLGLESRTPHTLLSTDAGEKVYPSVCPLRSQFSLNFADPFLFGFRFFASPAFRVSHRSPGRPKY